MKKIFTILTFLSMTSIFATDRFVDPNLSAGNGTTLFTSITSAVNAAVNGDRIIIASTTYNEPELTISKSLQIMPQTPGTTINFNANITISGFAGMKLEITGFNLGIYYFSSNPITSGSYSNRAKVSIIQCNSAFIDVNNNYYESNIILNQVTSYIAFRFGNIISNTTKNIYLLDESQDNIISSDKNLITNNQVTYMIGVFNNDYKFIIANNLLKDISIVRWNANTNVINKIYNNNFIANSFINFSSASVPNYNIIFTSNKFDFSFSAYNFNPSCGNYSGVSNYNTDPISQYRGPYDYSSWFPNWLLGWSNNPPNPPTNYGCSSYNEITTNAFPNPNFSGFFEWSYNGIDINCTIPFAGQPLALTKIIGPSIDIDGGKPSHDYYDIDLTINDRGRNGGPYSQLNYNPTSNPNNSKAFIFDLDMPTDLFPGQNIDIKAKGYHKN
jgi:hypothetical protein